MLHITNGDIAAGKLAAGDISGTILPWRDVLTDGPVPGGHDLESLSAVRARFLDEAFGDGETALLGLKKRDAALRRAMAGTEALVLWFEHDLYDQLQVLQILDVLAAADPWPPMEWICIDRHPAVADFRGLGQLTPRQLADLFPTREPVDDARLSLARRGWAAFTADDPVHLDNLLSEDLSALPFLGGALRRWRQEFPWNGGGLGRTERTILRNVAAGRITPAVLFSAVLEAEEAPFLGDWSIWRRIADLCDAADPLLACDNDEGFRYPPKVPADAAFREQRLRLTGLGRAVAEGAEAPPSAVPAERWYGGIRSVGGRVAPARP